MPIRSDFIFSTQKLQDYVDCPRRFELRYLQDMPWPALESEPYLAHEEHIQLGKQFHQLAQQLIIGIPSKQLQTQTMHPVLEQWWLNLLDFYPSVKDNHLLAEVKIGAAISEFRAIAVYDVLIIKEDASITILDWKTGATNKRPSSQSIRNRIQSKLYPLIYILANKNLLNQIKQKENMLQMMYWFPHFPSQPEVISYTYLAYENDLAEISKHIQEIDALTGKSFSLTVDKSHCKYCVYRSFCDRGISAGDFQDLLDVQETAQEDINLDFDHLEEIAF